MILFLSVSQRICLGFYCMGLITALILLTLVSLVCVVNEFDRIEIASRTINQANVLHLPTKIIYKEHGEKYEDQIGTVYGSKIEDEILGLSWVEDLHNLLIHKNSPQVNLVVADYKRIELLLNWLLVALVRLSPPLHNVIVLGIDLEVCKLLNPRKISCIHADPQTFMRVEYKLLKFSPVFVAPQTRLLVARLVNFWGFSFASYDTDALVLRDPQSIYDAHPEANVIAGSGLHWPQWATQEWGFAMCLGAVLMRSGPASG